MWVWRPSGGADWMSARDCFTSRTISDPEATVPTERLFGLGRLSLRGKLIALALTTGIIALGCTATGLIAYELLWFRGQLANRAATTSDILGSNTAVSLAFQNSTDVNQSLAA